MNDKNVTKDAKNVEHRLNIGEVLRRMGVIDQGDIDRAVIVQKANGKMLGESLVLNGACTEEDVERAVAVQKQLSGSDSSGTTVAAMTSLVNATFETARRRASNVIDFRMPGSKFVESQG